MKHRERYTLERLAAGDDGQELSYVALKQLSQEGYVKFASHLKDPPALTEKGRSFLAENQNRLDG